MGIGYFLTLAGFSAILVLGQVDLGLFALFFGITAIMFAVMRKPPENSGMAADVRHNPASAHGTLQKAEKSVPTRAPSGPASAGPAGADGANKPKPISVVITFLVHWIIGGGIAYIGQETSNKKEYYAGLIFIAIAVLLIIAQIVFSCSSFCETIGAFAVFSSECSSCDMHQALRGLNVLVSLASWLYVIVRLILIYNGKQNSVKFI